MRPTEPERDPPDDCRWVAFPKGTRVTEDAAHHLNDDLASSDRGFERRCRPVLPRSEGQAHRRLLPVQGEALLPGTAMKSCREDKPEPVILDLGLPDLSGIEVLQDLRSWSTVPVIVLSARQGSSDKVQALDADADDYVTKPFGMEKLLARVRAAVRRSSSVGEPTEVATETFRLSSPRSCVARRHGGAPHPDRVGTPPGARQPARQPRLPAPAPPRGVGTDAPGLWLQHPRVERGCGIRAVKVGVPSLGGESRTCVAGSRIGSRDLSAAQAKARSWRGRALSPREGAREHLPCQ